MCDVRCIFSLCVHAGIYDPKKIIAIQKDSATVQQNYYRIGMSVSTYGVAQDIIFSKLQQNMDEMIAKMQEGLLFEFFGPKENEK